MAAPVVADRPFAHGTTPPTLPKARRFEHLEKPNQLLCIDVLESYHPTASVRQQEGRKGWPPANRILPVQLFICRLTSIRIGTRNRSGADRRVDEQVIWRRA
jgi:hypothetical protein